MREILGYMSHTCTTQNIFFAVTRRNMTKDGTKIINLLNMGIHKITTSTKLITGSAKHFY